MARQSISKSLRFEVFKRDGFTCQYCGRMAPDVILEVDHINPVKRGGKNEILNLITSCFDCNRGKGQKPLSDNQVIKKQQEQLKELNEKREQLKMMLQWKKELEAFENEQVGIVENMFHEATNYTFTDSGKNNIKKAIKTFGISEVIESAKISISQYYDGTNKTIDKVFSYIPRICANRKKGNDPWVYKSRYIMAILRNRFNTYVTDKLANKLYQVVTDDESFNMVKDLACQSRGIYEFINELDELFE